MCRTKGSRGTDPLSLQDRRQAVRASRAGDHQRPGDSQDDRCDSGWPGVWPHRQRQGPSLLALNDAWALLYAAGLIVGAFFTHNSPPSEPLGAAIVAVAGARMAISARQCALATPAEARPLDGLMDLWGTQCWLRSIVSWRVRRVGSRTCRRRR
jgi:hypothetical protein